MSSTNTLNSTSNVSKNKILEQLQCLGIYLELKRLQAKERFSSQQQYEMRVLHLQSPTYMLFAKALRYQLLTYSTALFSATIYRETHRCRRYEQRCLKCARDAAGDCASSRTARSRLRREPGMERSWGNAMELLNKRLPDQKASIYRRDVLRRRRDGRRRWRGRVCLRFCVLLFCFSLIQSFGYMGTLGSNLRGYGMERGWKSNGRMGLVLVWKGKFEILT